MNNIEDVRAIFSAYIRAFAATNPTETLLEIADVLDVSDEGIENAEARVLEMALDACRAAVTYDGLIQGRVASGDVVGADQHGEGDDLDEAYFDWMQKATAALDEAKR